MKPIRRRFLHYTCAAEFVAASGATLAEDYVIRAIKLIVPHLSGGLTDLVARVVAEQIRKTLGQPVGVENVTGGPSGRVGCVAGSAPEGYMLLIGNNGSNLSMRHFIVYR